MSDLRQNRRILGCQQALFGCLFTLHDEHYQPDDHHYEQEPARIALPPPPAASVRLCPLLVGESTRPVRTCLVPNLNEHALSNSSTSASPAAPNLRLWLWGSEPDRPFVSVACSNAPPTPPTFGGPPTASRSRSAGSSHSLSTRSPQSGHSEGTMASEQPKHRRRTS